MYADIGWWGVNASGMTNLLETLDAKYKTVIVRMHCYGGAVFEGNAIFNCIRNMQAHTICINEGACMSMGTIVQEAFDERWGCSNGIWMYHSPITYLSGNARDLANASKLLVSLEKTFTNTFTRRTGKNKSVIQAFFDGSDHFLDAEEALNLGLIDKIVEPVAKDVKKLVITEDMSQVSHEDLYNKYAAYLVEDDEEQEEQQGNKRNKRKPAARRIASPEASGNETVTNQNDHIMKKLLIEAFALVGLTEASSDTAVLQAVQAKLQEKDTKISELNTQVAAAAKVQAEGMIAIAEQAAGKTFADAQKASLLTVAEKAGVEAFTAMLGLITPAGAAPSDNGGQQQTPPKTPTLHTMVNNGGGAGAGGNKEDRSAWSFDDWQKNDPEGLTEMSDDPKQYDAFAKLYSKAHKGAMPPRP